MSFDRSMTVLVHGHSKVGKSTLAVTAPYPRLYLDVEAASRFLYINKKLWDPVREAPPVADGTWDTCVVNVREYDDVLKVYQWLQLGKHQFASLIIDSISELQVRAVDKIAGRGQVQTQQWGDIFRAMAGLMRDIRDLTVHPTAPLEAVVLTSMTRESNGMYKPFLQGQMSVVAPYLFDLVCYLYVENIPNQDPMQPPHQLRRLLTRRSDMYEAGERVQGRLPGIIDNPNIENMIDVVFGPKPEPVAAVTTAQEGATTDAN
jgi:hypothetical protein